VTAFEVPDPSWPAEAWARVREAETETALLADERDNALLRIDELEARVRRLARQAEADHRGYVESRCSLVTQRDTAAARIDAIERMRRTIPTSWNNEADDYGLGWAAGAEHVLIAVAAALAVQP